jgi:hypothetical protein
MPVAANAKLYGEALPHALMMLADIFDEVGKAPTISPRGISFLLSDRSSWITGPICSPAVHMLARLYLARLSHL